MERQTSVRLGNRVILLTLFAELAMLKVSSGEVQKILLLESDVPIGYPRENVY